MHPTRHRKILTVVTTALLSGVLLSGCMDAGDRGLGPACESGLKAAQRAFEDAKAKNLGSVIDLTKAAGLIAAAKSQQQFDEYQNCVIKTDLAREILSRRN